MKFGGTSKERQEIKQRMLIEKITEAYNNKDRDFVRVGDIYGKNLFKRTLEDWKTAPFKNK